MNIESQSSSEWPRGLYWFGLTAAIFVFQLIPYTGVFLMFVAAPFWSAITVNFGFIHIAAEAFSGKIHKGWLVLPIIWIIGYAAFAFQSHMTMWRLDALLKEEKRKTSYRIQL